jgi:hypothetical protein
MTSRLTRGSLPCVIACVLLGAGCSSGKNALEKRVGSLQEELVALQNANDRLSERLTAIEMRRMQAAGTPESAEPASTPIERPPLKVVRMGPGSSPPYASEDPEAATETADDHGPRPVIRDLGSGRKARPRAAAGGVRQTQVGEQAFGER